MKPRNAAGFTLVELMAVIVVIGILVAVGFPSYQEQVRKGKRAEGKAALLKAAQLQERFFSDNNQYATQGQLAQAFGAAATIYSGENPNTPSSYIITVALGAGNTSHTLTATPNGGHTDPQCGNLTLNSAGVRGRTGAGPMNICW